MTKERVDFANGFAIIIINNKTKFHYFLYDLDSKDPEFISTMFPIKQIYPDEINKYD